LASSLPADLLDTKLELEIGELRGKDLKKNKKKAIETKFKKGRYPVWALTDFKDLQLESELMFESDMKVSLYNREKGIFGSENLRHIGDFAVPLMSLLRRSEKP
jgi:hypothetical protein